MFYSKSGTPFFTVSILFLSLLLSPSLHAQTVTGRVYDAQSEEPLQDAAIYHRGTTRGVTSAEDGSFEIQLLYNEEKILIVTFLGYASQLIELNGLYQAMEIFLNRATYIASDVFVIAARVDETTPVTYTNINREEIEAHNL